MTEEIIREIKEDEWGKFLSLYTDAMEDTKKTERNAKLKKALEYGNSLLAVCDRDRQGIRFYTMSIYALLGNLKDAEKYQKGLAARLNGGPDKREAAKKQIELEKAELKEQGLYGLDYYESDEFVQYKEKLKEDPYAFIEEGDRRTLYQLAMCYWKKGKNLLARRCLERLPQLGRFLSLSQEEIDKIHAEKDASMFGGYRMGTYEELINSVPIPKRYRSDFDNWILYKW